MTLREQIKSDLTRAMKEKDDVRKEALRVVLGELSRQGQKDLTDEDVVKILKKLLKSENELLQSSGAATSEFINILEGYLPKMATDEEILAWIRENIDFDSYKSKMQAMGPIMKHFGAAADGNRVRDLLQSL
ncbi:MAG: GatB/YqeY domain-containing protein [Desulfobacterales bacterium]|nr:GatB/YqeY domain-containing protein [Desulfobacterales bacterium]MCF8079481.1 GatB/YqeY domain-containing protein [Desulfobacterales bacterium]